MTLLALPPAREGESPLLPCHPPPASPLQHAKEISNAIQREGRGETVDALVEVEEVDGLVLVEVEESEAFLLSQLEALRR